MQGSTQLSELCRFVSDLTLDSFPPNALKQAKLILLDTAGVMAAGAVTPETDSFVTLLIDKRDGPVACPGRAESFSQLEAALVGGVAGSSLEYEEGNASAMGHPGVQLV
ncbi:MAG: MmgE/PrpD family protein, partial [Desulfobacteraceae bacterium]